MGELRFFIGLHQPGDACHFDAACVSINRLRTRRKPLDCRSVLVDSGAFTELNLHGGYRHGVADYAAHLLRLHESGVVCIEAAVAQDYMCEPFMLAKTGLTIADHQRLTIERYDELLAFGLPFPILPVLQGFAPEDYVRHIRAYGGRLAYGMWVGVGSVCKRNGSPGDVAAVLGAIKTERPDLRLHGFGLKLTALRDGTVRSLLYSADSMAWSFSARKQGRNGNDWREAEAFARSVRSAASRPSDGWQIPLPLGAAA